MTRTYTRYFNDESLDPIIDNARRLRENYTNRKKHIDTSVQSAIETRLKMLDAAIEMLGERVPE